MAGDLTALASTWNALPANPTLRRLAAINARMVAGPVIDIPVDTVSNALVQQGRMPGLIAYVNNTPSSPNAAALLACNYLVAILNGSDGVMLRTASQPGLLTILQSLTADARTGITAGNLTALNNAISPQQEWWRANGFAGPITIADLIEAGNLS